MKLAVSSLVKTKKINGTRKNEKEMEADLNERAPLGSIGSSRTQSKARTTAPVVKPSRYIRRSVKETVRSRDGSKCSYVDPQTNRKCDSAFKLQFDHVKEFSKGGSNRIENLRLLCNNHNQLRNFGKLSRRV